jgi:hypothetical protein
LDGDVLVVLEAVEVEREGARLVLRTAVAVEIEHFVDWRLANEKKVVRSILHETKSNL